MIKQLLHGQYLKFLHLHESFAETESDHFFSVATQESIEKFPRNITAIHVIDCVGRHEPINSTAIAEKMELSKASITKIGNKLLEDGLVKRTQMNDNKKEIYFRLTPEGKKIFYLHEQLHQVEAERFFRFLDKYSDGELKVIQHFLQDYSVDLEYRLTEGVAMK
nr:MarR family transcriptional regulator [Paenibacillus monticola]